MARKSILLFIALLVFTLLFLFIMPFVFDNSEKTEKVEEVTLHLDDTYYSQYKGQKKQVVVYNWGEYISDGTDNMLNINKSFTQATGVEVIYLTFSTNEELYAKLRSGNTGYDVIIPSDYMIGRMINEDMLYPLNHNVLPNFSNIDEEFQNPDYDPGSKFSVPYTWGVTGIIYNSELLKEGDVVDSWNILWDKDYAGEILMFSNSRDAFGIAEKKMGYSMNTSNQRELEDSLRELKKQKPLVQAYVMDEIFDKMVGGEATLAPYYAGDALTMMEDNPNLNFAIPKEGVNIFVDAAAIPATAENPEVAHMYLNFLMEPEIAMVNTEYIGYATPNKKAKQFLDEELTSNPIAYPPEEDIEKAEYFLPQDRETNLLIDAYWTELLSDDQSYNQYVVPVLLLLAIIASVGINIKRGLKRRNKKYYH